jgi:hypothetical protein
MARLGRAQPIPPKLSTLLVPAGPTNAQAGNATVTATAYNAAAFGGTIANAGAASVAATAYNASVSIKPTAGSGTATATANDATVPGDVLYATSVSSNGRYLQDQNGNPYFIQGASPQLLCSMVDATDMETFFADQQSRGINSVQVHPFANNLIGANGGSVNINGDAPFTNMATLSGTVSAYWTLVDTMFDLAETYGMTVWLSAPDNISYESTIAAMTNAQCVSFGTFIGGRYKNRPNLIWSFGNDWQSGQWSATSAKYLKVLEGIRAAGDTHLVTVWLDFTDSFSTEISSRGGFTGWNGEIDLNLCYSYSLPYYQTEQAYAVSPTIPTFGGEWNYEDEHLHTEFGESTTTDETLRRSAWWTVTWGGCGTFFGQHRVWQFLSGWESDLNTTAAQENQLVAELLTSFDNWQDLVPDTGHALLTAGRGTHDGSESADPLDNDYATIAKTADGSLAIGYFPTSRAITLDTSVMTAPVTGYWFDPTNGSTTVDNPPVVHPGANSAGQHDWVLVLEGAAPVEAAAGSASAVATGNNAAASVKPTGGVATSTATAYNATVAVSVSASAGSASSSATANNATTAVKTTGGVATVTATAVNATVSTSSATTAAAGAGSATATANNAAVSVSVSAGAAATTATANQPAADNGAGIATYFRIVRLSRPGVVRLRRPRLDL